MKIKNILISQPVPAEIEKSPYGEIIKKHGVHIEFHKFFKIEGVTIREFRDERIYINEYTAIVFNSKHAVDQFFRISKEVRVDVPETMKYFCMSESIAFYLQKYVQFRKRKIFHAPDVQQMMDVVKKHKTEKFLIPCSDSHNKELPNLFESIKVQFTEAIMYRTLPAEMKDLVDINSFDMIVFFSPQGIRSLFYNWPDFQQGDKLIGAFGSTTAQAATDAGLVVNIPAPSASAPSMTMAIDQYLIKNNKK
ncbi:MAG: uroporphyrinogen-III synthase [Bacteroidales bacterium]|nr:uroporphyrinogen-III synthase [Bacteroidales bacterium]MBK7172805.1 uroporphyrinogen-III synthase [Bacteroidales bacterium]